MASYEATNTAGKKETAMAQLNIGDKAPPFALKDQDGTHTSLADLSGRVYETSLQRP
jgi:cytochrome oxidase Cu insertion factor (SCO1/SenC/PrrC family)